MKVFGRTLAILLLMLPHAAQSQDWEVEAKQLEMYRQHWNTHNVYRYELLLDKRCFCDMTTPVRVVVENGKVVAVLDPETRQPLQIHRQDGTQDEVPIDLTWYPTIDEVFAAIENAITNHYGTTHPGPKADGFSVNYGTQYGYPTEFSVNYARHLRSDGSELRVTDSGMTYRLSELTMMHLQASSTRKPSRSAATSSCLPGPVSVILICTCIAIRQCLTAGTTSNCRKTFANRASRRLAAA